MFASKTLIVPTHYNKFHILIHWIVVFVILLQMITGDKIALEFLALRNEAITNNDVAEYMKRNPSQFSNINKPHDLKSSKSVAQIFHTS